MNRKIVKCISYCTGNSRVETFACFVAIALAWVLCFLTRLVPTSNSDPGLFQSVGERLLLGDRLYVDVYDNKGPLFYYLIAMERGLGPVSQYLFEAFFVLGAGWVTARIAAHFEPRVGRIEFVAIWLVAALAASMRFYAPGMPSAPALLISIAAIWACFERAPIISGLLAGSVFFTNILFFPPVFAFVTVYHFLFLIKRQPVIIQYVKYVAALIIMVGVIFLILAMRGELAGYGHVFENNLSYTQQNMAYASSFVTRLRNHLASILYFGTPVVGFGAIGAIWLANEAMRAERSQEWQVAALSTAALFPILLCEGAVLVTSDQHLTPWMLLSFLIFALAAPPIVRTWPVYGAAVAAGFSFLAVVGVGNYGIPVRSPDKFFASLNRLSEYSPETVLLNRISDGTSLTYARLGTNNDLNHAFGTGRYALKCPDFHQYYFYSRDRLNKILQCALSADIVIIHLNAGITAQDVADGWVPPFAQIAELNERWEDYGKRIDRAFAHGWTCQQAAGDTTADEIRVCRKQMAADRGVGRRQAYPASDAALRSSNTPIRPSMVSSSAH